MKFKESLLTSRVLTARLKRRYLCLQSPPCSSNTQNTQGGTCVLQPPGNKNKPDTLPFSQEKKKVSRDREAVSVLSCVMDGSVVCFPALSCALSSDTEATPASLSSLSGIFYDVSFRSEFYGCSHFQAFLLDTLHMINQFPLSVIQLALPRLISLPCKMR